MGKGKKYINDIFSDKAYHWLMFLKHNNLGFLRLSSLKVAPKKVELDVALEALEAFHEIDDQIIEEFGMDYKFLEQKVIQEEIAMLKLDFIINGKKFNRTAWKIKESSIHVGEEVPPLQLTREISIISKNIGTGIIDIKEYTIFQYLTAKSSNSQ